MKQYLDAVQDVLLTGQRSSNRTGTDTLFKHGLYMTFDMADGFPAVTTKELNWRSCFAEMLGFWRGLDNAEDFRELGTRVWDANADQNETWNQNPNKRCNGDLGRIYGVQAREWNARIKDLGMGYSSKRPSVDQLLSAYNDLCAGIDNRREIVTHWNPGELAEMALPPCHMFYQFGLRPGAPNAQTYLDLFVYVRSNDMGLGMPFNIAGYAWLLHVMAQITNKIPGNLHYFAWNYHIYMNHIEALRTQLSREPKPLPNLTINPDIRTLTDVDQRACMSDFDLQHYNHHEKLFMPMAV